MKRKCKIKDYFLNRTPIMLIVDLSNQLGTLIMLKVAHLVYNEGNESCITFGGRIF